MTPEIRPHVRPHRDRDRWRLDPERCRTLAARLREAAREFRAMADELEADERPADELDPAISPVADYRPPADPARRRADAAEALAEARSRGGWECRASWPSRLRNRVEALRPEIKALVAAEQGVRDHA